MSMHARRVGAGLGRLLLDADRQQVHRDEGRDDDGDERRTSPCRGGRPPRPLNTDVIANATPFAVPTSPFARSRPSSGTSRVTVVERATDRRLPAIAPPSTSTMNAQKPGWPRSRSADAGATTKTNPASAKADERDRAREQHRRPAQVPVHVGPEEHRRDGDQEHVAAADDRRGQHGPGLEVDPERQREPQEVVRDVGDERVRDEQMEGTHRVTSMTAPPSGPQTLDRQVATCLSCPPWTCSRPSPIPPGGPSSMN